MCIRDSSSIDYCHRIGLNYVSCSPPRVPVARLAAAQAKLRNSWVYIYSCYSTIVHIWPRIWPRLSPSCLDSIWVISYSSLPYTGNTIKTAAVCNALTKYFCLGFSVSLSRKYLISSTGSLYQHTQKNNHYELWYPSATFIFTHNFGCRIPGHASLAS